MNETKKEHEDLILSIISGFLIFLAWRMETTEQLTGAMIIYICTYLISINIKAKESIRNKSITIEIIVILAAIILAIIGYWFEGALLIFIFATSSLLKRKLNTKSQQALSSITTLQPKEAALVRGGFDPINTPLASLQIGDHIQVNPGERIPIDGTIFKGKSSVNEEAITGEKVILTKKKNDEVFAGTLNISGQLTIHITKEPNDSLLNKMLTMVDLALYKKSSFQQSLVHAQKAYISSVAIIAFIMVGISHYGFDWDVNIAIYRSILLLIVALPLISITPTIFSALSSAAKNKVFIQNEGPLRKLSDTKAIIMNESDLLSIDQVTVMDFNLRPNEDEQQVAAALVAICTQTNLHFSQAVKQYVAQWDYPSVIAHIVSESDGEIRASVLGRAFQLSWDASVVSLKDEHGVVATIHLKNVVSCLQNLDVKVFLFSSKDETTTHALANKLKLDGYEAGCSSSEKVNKIKQYTKKFHNVTVIGNERTDQAAFAAATVSVAINNDAQMILLQHDLAKVVHTIKLARKKRKIMMQNLLFSGVVISLLIILNYLQIMSLPIGVIAHECSAILLLLNGLRIIRQ